ncbi:MAG: T9SS type A sorting domain-containing protein [Bacteroidetes bacterium]|nr:T9SS type A sorting domain-containing protein [Bacteroidota bacterium]MBU1578740.1 T9SS type A sorting domain-containing protein [Bacteroidota bacterium]MBU2558289.1 T9SS type A sorting domain-containing protein [Bacteroidota bacterium]
MKKILLTCGALLIAGSGLLAQSLKQNENLKSMKKFNHALTIDPIKPSTVPASQQEDLPVLPPNKNTNIVSIIDIGTSANAYGYYAGTRSMVWYDRDLNAVANLHRMGGAGDPGGYSGDLGFDFSLDGGETWTNDTEIYEATENAGGEYYTDAARYPSMGIFNPNANADPDESWLVFFAPNLEGTNDGWGGYSYGVANMGDPAVNTKNLQSSPPDVYQLLPSGFEISENGTVYVTDLNHDLAADIFQNSIILEIGEWSESEEDIIYEQQLIDHFADPELGSPSDVKVAFGSGGETGYISVLSDDGSAEAISGFKGLYPVIYKTTDGGLSWDELGGIQLGGPEGLEGIVYDLLTDEQIAELYEEPLPTREEIPYTTAFDHDIIVDADGNLHIAVVIGITAETAYSITTGVQNILGAYDIYTTDGGETWHAIKMGSLLQFRGTWGDISDDNRIQITASEDRETIFVSWNDTDLEDQEDNSRPNVYARGMKPNVWGSADLTCVEDNPEPTNVTLFSEGMWNATFVCVSPNTREVDGNYYIPMVYQALQDGSDIDPTQFKYIKDFYFTDADFCVVGNEEIAAVSAVEVGQNFPNPFSNETNVTVSLKQGSNLNLEVYNITGQKVLVKDYGYKTAGSFTMTISADELPTGVYFYTVEAGADKVTRKMIVQ